MFRLAALLSAVLSLAPLAPAQVPPEYGEQFNKGIAALTGGRHDEGIASFKRCLEINPKDATCAYNIACGFSLKKETEAAFEWLGQAVEWGFGNGDSRTPDGKRTVPNAEFAQLDSDLDHLKTDPRWEKAVARMGELRARREELKKKGEEYAATAAVHVPAAALELEEKPLLVVLHDALSTKDEVIAGRWKAIADELGFALVAPSGKVLVKDKPEEGMAWFDNVQAYVQSAWTFEKPVHDAVSAFRKEHKVDKARVYLAGEGIGGLVALNVAIGSPGLYKGVVALNGSIVPQLMSQKAPNAGKMGLRAHILVDLAGMRADLGKPEEAQKLLEAWNKSLETWGITGGARAIEPGEEGKNVQAEILAALRSLAPAEAAK